MTHVVQVLNVWDKGALIKVRTVTGEERIVYSPLLELEWMLWEAGSAKKNLPLDSKALNHNGTYGYASYASISSTYSTSTCC